MGVQKKFNVEQKGGRVWIKINVGRWRFLLKTIKNLMSTGGGGHQKANIWGLGIEKKTSNPSAPCHFKWNGHELEWQQKNENKQKLSKQISL